MVAARIFVFMKPLALAKSRLASVVEEEDRKILSLAMLAQVLRAARDVAEGAQVTVVGGDEPVRRLADREGVGWREEAGSGLNQALAAILGVAASDDAGTNVYLPADLPLIAASDVKALLDKCSPDAAVIAPDRWDTGTNALALPAAIGFQPSLGDNSFEKHQLEAARSGLMVRVCTTPGLLLDVDTPADLSELLTQRPNWWDEARGLVDRLGLDTRIKA